MGKIKIDTLKSHSDFRSSDNLNDLVSNEDLIIKLKKDAEIYQKNYLQSFMMNSQEVLEYIPLDSYNDYDVFLRHKNISFKEYVSIWKNNDIEKYDLYDALKSLKYHDKKIFIINTLKKRIDVCDWNIKKIIGTDVKDFGLIDFKVDSFGKKLTVLVDYWYPSRYKVGGVTITAGTGRQYVSGGSWKESQSLGTLYYTFCTKTNKYLGFNSSKERKSS